MPKKITHESDISHDILLSSEVLSILGMKRSAFERAIRPLMQERGECRKIGKEWAFSKNGIWRWREYSRIRQRLIDAEVWTKKRRHSIADLEDIVSGRYDEIN